MSHVMAFLFSIKKVSSNHGSIVHVVFDRVLGLCYLMMPGLSKDIQCHVWPYFFWAPLGDKVSTGMLTHIYPHKAWRKIEVIICKITGDSPLYMWPDVWSADLDLLIKSMVIHDTQCPYWDQVSLNNTNQTKLFLNLLWWEYEIHLVL